MNVFILPLTTQSAVPTFNAGGHRRAVEYGTDLREASKISVAGTTVVAMLYDRDDAVDCDDVRSGHSKRASMLS